MIKIIVILICSMKRKLSRISQIHRKNVAKLKMTIIRRKKTEGFPCVTMNWCRIRRYILIKMLKSSSCSHLDQHVPEISTQVANRCQRNQKTAKKIKMRSTQYIRTFIIPTIQRPKQNLISMSSVQVSKMITCMSSLQGRTIWSSWIAYSQRTLVLQTMELKMELWVPR